MNGLPVHPMQHLVPAGAGRGWLPWDRNYRSHGLSGCWDSNMDPVEEQPVLVSHLSSPTKWLYILDFGYVGV